MTRSRQSLLGVILTLVVAGGAWPLSLYFEGSAQEWFTQQVAGVFGVTVAKMTGYLAPYTAAFILCAALVAITAKVVRWHDAKEAEQDLPGPNKQHDAFEITSGSSEPFFRVLSVVGMTKLFIRLKVRNVGDGFLNEVRMWPVDCSPGIFHSPTAPVMPILLGDPSGQHISLAMGQQEFVPVTLRPGVAATLYASTALIAGPYRSKFGSLSPRARRAGRYRIDVTKELFRILHAHSRHRFVIVPFA